MSQAANALKAKIGLAFKREGLVLQGKDVMDFLLAQLKEHSEDQSFLIGLLKSIDRQALKQNFVDLAALQRAVSVVTMDVGAKVEEESLRVISGLQCPRHKYHDTRKTFVPLDDHPPLHGGPDDQANMFRHRFDMIRQRLLRHELFAQHKLTTVESLLGVTGRKVVFGMLTRDNHGELILEDLNNHVKVDMSAAKIDEFFYTDHCMVLADGELVQGKFHVHVLTMPPIEEPSVTHSLFKVEMFGGAVDPSLRNEIAAYQRAAEHVMFVVLSDVWLDKPNVMAKLETVFEGFKDIVPTAFIFMGNYTSRPFASTAEDVQRLQQTFQGLARLIIKFKSLATRSHWIFSRGPSDGGGPLVYPQTAIPDFFIASLKQRLTRVTFTTNPFRLRWCNVRMTFFRENLMAKMRRHTLFPHLRFKDPHVLLVRTLVEQSHLCPLPQSICPVYWNYDQAMQLYPIPEVLVLADAHDQYVVREDGYTAANPGSFSTDFTFLIVRPATLEVEESSIREAPAEEVDEYVGRMEEQAPLQADAAVEDDGLHIEDLDKPEPPHEDEDEDDDDVEDEQVAKTQLVPDEEVESDNDMEEAK